MDVRSLAARRDVRWGGAGAVVLVAAIVAFSVSSGGSTASSGSSTAQSAAAAGQDAPTRWWSNAAEQQGSRIDEANPLSAANVLVPSQDGYCAMLKQTVAAGGSILPDAKAGDRALIASTRAFLAELQSVAPPAVAAEWKTLSPTLIALVSGRALPADTSAQAKANAAAAKAISADAKSSCGVVVSR